MLPRCRFIALVPLSVMFGCELPGRQPDYDSYDPAERALAAVETHNDRDYRDIPELIEQLDSSDPAVRMFAAEALQALTGETLGYQFSDPELDRRDATDRWEAWWRENKERYLSGQSTSLKESRP